jgi:glutathione S-transferase
MISMELYQFPISHYCEKVRFALDYKGLDYSARNLLPGLHRQTTTRFGAGSSVPVLCHGSTGIQGSAAIITYLDEISVAKPLTPSEPGLREDALEWERWLDAELGVDVRRYGYHTLLSHRSVVTGFLATDGAWWSRLYLGLAYNRLRAQMRQFMEINDATAEQSLQRIRQGVERLNARYQQREYLVGDRFTRADLAAAALCAPLFMPARYGLDWPDPMPEPLASTARELAPQLEWAQRIYRDWRQRPNEKKSGST